MYVLRLCRSAVARFAQIACARRLLSTGVVIAALMAPISVAQSPPADKPASPEKPVVKAEEAGSSKPDDGQSAGKTAEKPAAPTIYDEKADAKAVIAAATAKAKRENQRVLLMFGGNWCGWCQKLHAVFGENAEIKKLLSYEYQRVMVDIGKFDKNLDIAAGYNINLKKTGVPFLAIVNPETGVAVIQETGSLESGEQYDVQKVKDLLTRCAATPLDAEKVLEGALADAKKQDKMRFLHLGAPWCGWCRRLDEFMARPEIAAILERDFINTKIDLDRMTNGKAVASRFRKNPGGIPWFAFVDGDGKALVTSDLGQERMSIGYPSSPPEIEHFVKMLKSTVKRITAGQIDALVAGLKAGAEKH